MCMRGVMGAPKKNSILLLVFGASLELPLLELPSSSSDDGTSSGSGLGWAMMRRTRRRHMEGSSMWTERSDCCDDGPLIRSFYA